MNANYLYIIGFVVLTALVFTQEGDEKHTLETKIKFELNEDEYGTDEKVKLGLYLEDIDFETAYEMHYPHCYGVKISGVISGSNAHKAGLTDDDIIMEFDGEQVRYEDHLISLRNTKQIGDMVEITFFRNEKINTTNLTFHPAKEKEDEDEDDFYISKSGKKKKKLSPGYGGGYPCVIKLDYDFSEINSLISQYGLSPLTSDNAVMYGGGGMGNIGKGWFMGGMGAGMLYTQSIPSIDTNYTKTTLKVESGFAGVSLLKKIPILTERVVLDIGTTLGGGETIVEVANTDGTYSWDSIGTNSYAKYSKSYFTFYPEVGVLVRIKNWVGIRAGAGQLLTYSADNSWTDSTFGMNIAGDSPSPLNGQALSLAIWFGF
ncbi:MAG: PDZ domain-containing protein [Candidatus Marinimicrobia bacterium]|nr:PDZ domain-containing protein [Candidatus Neomarinimicrobiota bacterium]